jgi:hypothetical protein
MSVDEGLETIEFDVASTHFTNLIQKYEMYEMAGVEEWRGSDYEESNHDD